MLVMSDSVCGSRHYHVYSLMLVGVKQIHLAIWCLFHSALPRKYVLMQVDYLSKCEFFGDVSVTKSPIAQTTAVTSTMTTTLLVISK